MAIVIVSKNRPIPFLDVVDRVDEYDKTKAYVFIPDGIHRDILPMSRAIMAKLPSSSLLLRNGCKVIVNGQDVTEVNSKLLSPFDAFIDFTDDDIVNGRNDMSIVSLFWALQRTSIVSWEGDRDKGRKALALMLSYQEPSFIDLVICNYDSIKHNVDCYKIGKPGSLLTCNPIISLREGAALTMPTAFVVNLESRSDRWANMNRRLGKLKLDYVMVKAIDKASDLIDHVSWKADHLNAYGPQMKGYDRRAEFACYLSHIKAIKAFIESGTPVGLILEDDAALHKRFNEIMMSVLSKLPLDFKTVSLMVSDTRFYARHRHDFTWPERYVSVIPLESDAWGTTGYLISRSYALKMIDAYDLPIRLCPTIGFSRVTSEAIMWNSRGLATSLPLVIDDMSESNINPSNAEYHKRLFEGFGFDNYDLN